MPSPRERRRSDRVPVRLPLRFWVLPAEGSPRTGTVEDVGAGGVRLRAGAFIPERARLRLDLTLPGMRPVPAIVEAAWVRECRGNGSFEVGGAFLERSARLRLEGYLRAVAAQGSSL